MQRSGGRQDGCATLWKAARFSCSLAREIHFEQHGLKDNVALLALLKPEAHAAAACKPPAPAALAECGLLVANTHILFTPEQGDIKLGQVRGGRGAGFRRAGDVRLGPRRDLRLCP